MPNAASRSEALHYTEDIMNETQLANFAKRYAAQIATVRKGMAMNFDVPAQQQINDMFRQIGVSRFTKSKDDVWEQVICHMDGDEYVKPPARLIARWATY